MTMKKQRKKLKEVDPKRSQAQTGKPCCIAGCGRGGRTLARMGNNELTYCGHHRKYGERVINFLIRAVFGEKLKDFLKESKDDLFMKNMPELSQDSYDKLNDYVNKMIHKLDDLQKWHNKTK